MRLALHDLEMQVRAGRISGGAGDSKQVSFANGLAASDGNACEVGIQRLPLLGVVQNDGVAKSPLRPLCQRHDAAFAGIHRGTSRGSYIIAAVALAVFVSAARHVCGGPRKPAGSRVSANARRKALWRQSDF